MYHSSSNTAGCSISSKLGSGNYNSSRCIGSDGMTMIVVLQDFVVGCREYFSIIMLYTNGETEGREKSLLDFGRGYHTDMID